MKKTLCIILLCCVVSTSFAESNNPSISSKIEQTADLQVIKREIFASPKDTLVVFDIDLVLTTPSDEIFILSVTDETPGTQSCVKVTLSCLSEYSIFAENINAWIQQNNITRLNVFSNFVKS